MTKLHPGKDQFEKKRNIIHKSINKAVMERYGSLSPEASELHTLYMADKTLTYCINALKTKQYVSANGVKALIEVLEDLRSV